MGGIIGSNQEQNPKKQQDSKITQEELNKCDERLKKWNNLQEKLPNDNQTPQTAREQMNASGQLILRDPQSEIQFYSRGGERNKTETNAEQYVAQNSNLAKLTKQVSVPQLQVEKIEQQQQNVTSTVLKNMSPYRSYLPEQSEPIPPGTYVQIQANQENQKNNNNFLISTPLNNPQNNEQNAEFSPEKLANSNNQLKPQIQLDDNSQKQLISQKFKYDIPLPSGPDKNDVFGTQAPGVAHDLNQPQQGMVQTVHIQPQLNEPKIESVTPFLPMQIVQYYPPWLIEMLQTFGQYCPPMSNTNFGQTQFQQASKLNDKEIYEGQQQFGKKHGFGITLTENEFYQGYFFDDQKEGYGRILVKGGVMKSGLWVNGLIEADMKLQDSRYKYEGECLHSNPHGQGSLEDPISRYQGQFQNGKKHGKGVLYFKKDESRYEGDFDQDRMHGRGKYYFKSGKIHEGGYQNNKYHGEGIMIWPDGRSYKGKFWHHLGNFVNSFRQGKGIQVEADGGVYDGQWFEDMKDGYGSYTKNGINITGKWKQNEYFEE